MDYANHTILNGPVVPQSVLLKALSGKNVPQAEEIVIAYTALGTLTSIGNLLPFAQAIHETGWFSSWRWRKNNNPAGLGATNDGAVGNAWKTPIDGILAQYAHLLAYSVKMDGSQDPKLVHLAKLSPRYTVLERVKFLGIATVWSDLNGRWAYPGTTYAQAISRIANTIL